MKSVWNFIVKPIGDRYDNSIKVEDKDLILNSSIEKFKFINRKAVVMNVPTAYNTVIEEGDEAVSYTHLTLPTTSPV